MSEINVLVTEVQYESLGTGAAAAGAAAGAGLACIDGGLRIDGGIRRNDAA